MRPTIEINLRTKCMYVVCNLILFPICFFCFVFSFFLVSCVLACVRFFPSLAALRLLGKRVGENGPWNQVPQINTKSNATTYQVTGLIPFTVYSFRTRAVNSLGVSQPSKESYYIVSLREGKITNPKQKTQIQTHTKQNWKPYFRCYYYIVVCAFITQYTHARRKCRSKTL